MSQRDDPAQTQNIRTLSDAEAVRALTALVEDRGLLPSTGDLPATAEELRDAVDAEVVADHLPPGVPPVSQGDLARAALEYAATQEDLASVVDEAVEHARSPMDRIDPVSVSVAALAVTLLQTEVVVKRDNRGRWSLTVHKRALRDSALGRLLTALLTHLTDGK
ncbi:hypothetical protein [Streptomyces sp. NPDC007346]|uniref:hypothetical protein n=1 Tax=Streptomyces sp. NPDC007346 TaxID=3154682 RepID=UPI003456450B